MSSARRLEASSAPLLLCTDLVPAERVSDKLREALNERSLPDDPDAQPRAFSLGQLETLRAMLDRVVPAAGAYGIDLALRLDRMMAQQDANGWRYEALPTDPDAYQIGLETLDALAKARTNEAFHALSHDEQDMLLATIQSAETAAHGDPKLFDADQMALWFEEVRSDAVRHYVAHPAIMARIGYSGFANGGGAGEGFVGFHQVGIGEREAWEPQPVAARSAPEAAR